MTTVEQNDLIGNETTSSIERSPHRFQFSVLDIAILLALHAVVINGTLEFYRSGSADRTPIFRDGLRRLGAPPPPTIPEPPVVAVLGGGTRFTAFWLRRFAACVIVGSLAILLSFFGTTLARKNASPHVRRAVPRLAAALASLIFLTALAGFTFLCHNAASYIETDGYRIHPAIHAARLALGPAIAVTCIIAGLEIASYLNCARSRKPGAPTEVTHDRDHANSQRVAPSP